MHPCAKDAYDVVKRRLRTGPCCKCHLGLNTLEKGQRFYVYRLYMKSIRALHGKTFSRSPLGGNQVWLWCNVQGTLTYVLSYLYHHLHDEVLVPSLHDEVDDLLAS